MADHLQIPPTDPTTWYSLIITGIAGLSYGFGLWLYGRVENFKRTLEDKILVVRDDMNKEMAKGLLLFATKPDLSRVEDSLKADILRIENFFREEQEKQTQHIDQRISQAVSQLTLAIARGNRPLRGED